MKILEPEELDYSDLLIKPRNSSINSRRDVFLHYNYTFKHSKLELPGRIGIIAANMFTTGTFAVAEIMNSRNMLSCLHKHYPADKVIEFLTANPWAQYNVMVSTGIRDGDHNRIKQILDSGICNFVCVDAPNGYIEKFTKYVKQLRTEYPHIIIAAGNVLCSRATISLIHAGADIVKVGIGGGSACTTRKVTSVGRPMATTVIECGEAAHSIGGRIIADGGITCTGDISVAFGCGADFVMIGGFIAGSDEADGDTITKYYQTNELDTDETNFGIEYTPGFAFSQSPKTKKIISKKYKKFYGMSSNYSQAIHYGTVEKWRSNEGRYCEIPNTGPLVNTLLDIESGLRSTATYINATSPLAFNHLITFYKTHTKLNTKFAQYEQDKNSNEIYAP